MRAGGRRFLLHLAVAVIATAPLVWRMGDRLPLGRERVATVPLFNLWSLRWTAARLPHGLSGWWDSPIFWPTRGTYANSELQPLTGAAFGVLRLVLADPAAYGVLVIGALALSGVAGNALARRLGAGAVAAAGAGVLAQTLPFLFAQLGVIQLLMLWPVGFALARLVAWGESARIRDAVAAGAWVAVSFLTCGYHAALFTTCAVVAFPLFVAPSWWAERRARLGGVLLGSLAVVLPVLPFLVGQHHRLEGIRWADSTIQRGSATWTDLAPGGEHWAGVVLTGLALAGLVVGRDRRPVRYLGGLAGVALVLALGSNLSLLGWHPYAVLVDHVGPFARLRSPFRATAIAQLAFSGLAGVVLEQLWAARRALPRVVGILAVGAAVVAGDLGPGELVALPARHTVWSDWLAEHPGGSVVMLPAASGRGVADFEPTAEAMVQALDHGHPLVNGYSGFFPDEHRALREGLATFPDVATLARLRELGVTYAVADSVWWTSTRDATARRLGVEIVLAGPDGVLIDLTPSPRPD